MMVVFNVAVDHWTTSQPKTACLKYLSRFRLVYIYIYCENSKNLIVGLEVEYSRLNGHRSKSLIDFVKIRPKHDFDFGLRTSDSS